MIGAILNCAGIVFGALLGWTGVVRLSPATQVFIKSGLAAFTAFFGLRLVLVSLEGPLFGEFRQLLIVALAVVVGGWVGRLLQLQRWSNRLGRRAGELLLAAQKQPPGGWHDGFLAATVLFTAAPLGLIGAVAEGLTGGWHLLAVKAVMDGLATAGFARFFRPGFVLAAFPVWLFLQLVSEAGHEFALPFLAARQLTWSVTGAAGLLACLVTLVILGARRVELAAYLPALVLAPLLAHWLG